MSSRTTNLNLVKPSSDENVSLPIINGNYDILDSEVSGRVKKTDVVNNLTSTGTNVPLSANMGKKLQDEKVAISSIVNNLTSTGTNVPLSANMGKTLSDTVTYKTGGSAIPSDTDLNAMLTGGVYWADTSARVATILNKPSQITVAFTLVVAGSSSRTGCIQYIYNDQGAFIRRGSSTGWTEWQKLATDSQKVNIADIVDALTSTATNKPLSAKQGKVLNEVLTALGDRFKEKVAYISTFQADNDLNTVIKTGLYQVSGGLASTPAPPWTNASLLIVVGGGSASDNRILQIIIKGNGITDSDMSIAYRKCSPDPTVASNWSKWYKLVTETDMPLSASLLNQNARVYQFADSSGNAYPAMLRRNYTNPSWITVGSGITTSGDTIVEVVGNMVIVSFAINVASAFTGSKNIMTFTKYIPVRYVRSVASNETGEARALSFGNGSGNLVMYGASAGRYRGEIVYAVDTIPAE